MTKRPINGCIYIFSLFRFCWCCCFGLGFCISSRISLIHWQKVESIVFAMHVAGIACLVWISSMTQRKRERALHTCTMLFIFGCQRYIKLFFSSPRVRISYANWFSFRRSHFWNGLFPHFACIHYDYENTATERLADDNGVVVVNKTSNNFN